MDLFLDRCQPLQFRQSSQWTFMFVSFSPAPVGDPLCPLFDITVGHKVVGIRIMMLDEVMVVNQEQCPLQLKGKNLHLLLYGLLCFPLNPAFFCSLFRFRCFETCFLGLRFYFESIVSSCVSVVFPSLLITCSALIVFSCVLLTLVFLSPVLLS